MVHFHTNKELAAVDLTFLTLHLWSENNYFPLTAN